MPSVSWITRYTLAHALRGAFRLVGLRDTLSHMHSTVPSVSWITRYTLAHALHGAFIVMQSAVPGCLHIGTRNVEFSNTDCYTVQSIPSNASDFPSNFRKKGKHDWHYAAYGVKWSLAEPIQKFSIF